MTSSKATSSAPFSPGVWFAAFAAGFLAVILIFFHFYAGVFAREILEERAVELPQLSLLTLNGVLPLSFGLLASVLLLSGFFALRLNLRARKNFILAATVIGVIGIAATLWGLYAPVA